MGQGLLMIAVHEFSGRIRNVDPVVKVTYGSNLFFPIVIAAAYPTLKFGTAGGGETFEGLEQKEGFFVVDDVAADVFAKGGGIAINIEPVVLQLKGNAGGYAKAIEGLGLRVACAANEGAGLETGTEQNGGLESDHFEVIFDAHAAALLKFHVVLLAFADFETGATEELEYGAKTFGGTPGHQLIGEDGHSIARKYGGIAVPLPVHGGPIAAHVGLVHDVVVQEGEVVEDFEAQGRVKAVLYPLGVVQGAAQEAEHGPDALSAQR